MVIAKCGVGKVCAAVCAQTMIFHFGADTLINSGVAGALDTSLSIGDIVIATSLVQHDVDTSPLGDPVGYISELKKIEMPTSSALVDLAEKVAQKQNVRYHKGVIASGDCFVAAPETKQTIRQRFGAKACEMEGGAMAQVCQMNDVPFVVLRAISDTADDRASMDYPTFVAIAAEKMAKLVKEVLKEM
ncbi:MAG: 5'-methylthioadenosine/adenosylhomocysteine nucleosidase [Clostridia bacterium]|nr:5'-methylthioadenosine/adenosylhomocysteine nucleosidase [Clostridia bacterium]